MDVGLAEVFFKDHDVGKRTYVFGVKHSTVGHCAEKILAVEKHVASALKASLEGLSCIIVHKAVSLLEAEGVPDTDAAESEEETTEAKPEETSAEESGRVAEYQNQLGGSDNGKTTLLDCIKVLLQEKDTAMSDVNSLSVNEWAEQIKKLMNNKK